MVDFYALRNSQFKYFNGVPFKNSGFEKMRNKAGTMNVDLFIWRILCLEVSVAGG